MKNGEFDACDAGELLDCKTKLRNLLDAVGATILIQDDPGKLPDLLHDAYHRAGGDLMMIKEQAE